MKGISESVAGVPLALYAGGILYMGMCMIVDNIVTKVVLWLIGCTMLGACVLVWGLYAAKVETEVVEDGLRHEAILSELRQIRDSLEQKRTVREKKRVKKGGGR